VTGWAFATGAVLRVDGGRIRTRANRAVGAPCLSPIPDTWWDAIAPAVHNLVKLEDNLVNVDPKFVDEQAGNFQLRADSPAWNLGFQRIPVEKIGLYQDESRASWPVSHRVRPMPVPPKK